MSGLKNKPFSILFQIQICGHYTAVDATVFIELMLGKFKEDGGKNDWDNIIPKLFINKKKHR